MKRVLFFDSGFGGLSVYAAVRHLNTALEYYFLFDNECFPYGEKSEEFLIGRICTLIGNAIEQFTLSAIVIACNTASTVALPALRERFDVPIVGVVPAIKPAALQSKKKIIGLLATPGTVSRRYTHELIRKYASDCKVILAGDPDLAGIAERYLLNNDEIDEAAVRKSLSVFTDLPEAEKPDKIVLGCTHYPLLLPKLKKVMPEADFIDSGEAIGRRVHSILEDSYIETLPEERTGDRAFYTGELKDPHEDDLLKRFGFKSLERFSYHA